MSFTADFSLAQVLGNLTTFTLADTSDYTDEPKDSFSARRIFIYKTDGTTLVPDGTTTTYIDFSFDDYPDDEIDIDVLDRDYGLFIVLELISTDPQPTSEYTKTIVTNITAAYTNDFIYEQVQLLTAHQDFLYNKNWFYALSSLQTLLDCSNQAVLYQDIQSAQLALDKAKYLMDNWSTVSN